MACPDLASIGDGLQTLPSIRSQMDFNNQVEVDFLFPNGIIIPLAVNYFSPLDHIKQIIWREVHNFPLAHHLSSQDSYMFVFINKLGEKEEVLDESQNLEELQPFIGLFQIVKKREDSVPKTLDKNINFLIGRGLQQQESFQDAEISHFRQKMAELCREITAQRSAQSPIEKFMWRYPVRLRSTPSVPAELKGVITDGFIVVDVGFSDTNFCYKLRVDHMGSPSSVIKAALLKRNPPIAAYPVDTDAYLLKIIGQEEFLYGNSPLIQFKYVYQCLLKNIAPHFWIVPRSTLPEATPPIPVRRPPPPLPTSSSVSKENGTRTDKSIIVWNVETAYRIHVKEITKLQLTDASKIKLYIGIYHGGESLCKEKETEELTVFDGSCCIKADIVFDMRVADLPHAARLCFALYTIGNNTKRKDLTSWVNIPIYDFKLRLQRGDRGLPMWPHDQLHQPEENCNPLGGVSLNSMCMDATFLKISFPDLAADIGSAYLIYPPYDMVLECASKNMEPDGSPGSPSMRVSSSYIEQLYQSLHQTDQLCEQDKDLIWLLRFEVWQRFPNMLSKVLQSIKWKSFVDVAKMTALLQTWPTLPVDHALEILDFEYPDHNVRAFAVKCLNDKLSDDDVSQYMLQLAQALKFETHLYCPLAKFLLQRALKNQHLGHKLFWLLRSEIHNPVVSTQYSLILQCYLNYNQDHLQVLMKQQEALKKLYALNSLIKEGNIADQARREEAKQHMKKVLSQPTYQKCLSDLYSPLSPLFKMKELKVEQCKFMNSKKRPLWLVWSNADYIGTDIQIIYKNGDDLRQDMLTLQILQVMDNIWQAEGLDFRMNPYMCMATDVAQGMIEVVSPADTMANIQRWYKNNAFDKKALFEWLKQKHDSEKSLDAAVEEFIMSCAGYCVATYVLGIGDRHNDNIMMKDSGQMFHIDFGHFLGNFKSKFHVKRERVPFVLTSHFVYVITKGDSKKENFERFQSMCEKAFMILRGRHSLLTSLFMMMLSGGIPQLTSPKDVSYLNETLVPHLSDTEALKHFKTKFNDALLGSWKTSLNFWFHMKAK